MKFRSTKHPVSRSRIFFFILLLAASSTAYGRSLQSRTVEVSTTAGSRIESAPGKLLTLSFKVTNLESSKRKFESALTLPRGWRKLSREIPFEIGSSASDIRLASISIPSETPAGEYPIKYSVHDVANISESAELALTVVVAAVTDQALRLIDAPRLVVAGESYTAEFLLTNKGNVSGVVQLAARSSSGFPAAPDSAALHMVAGESRSVKVTVRTDENILSKEKDVVELSATFAGGKPVLGNGFVEVVPRVTGVEDRYIRFPLLTTLRFAGSGAGKGTQIEIAGTGSLADDPDGRLRVLVRTPDIQQKSLLGKRDEYQLNYVTSRYDLYVGDKNFSLSPLTEYNRYAFGASGTATIDRWSAGGFYNRTRFYAPTQTELAGFLKYRVIEGAQVGINYLAKREPLTSSVVTLRGNLRPLKSGELDLEYGRGEGAGKTDDAYMARWNMRESWLAMDARYIHSGANYTGYFNNLDLKNISLNLLPVRALRLEAYYREETRNLNRDTTLGVVPHDRYIQAGVGLENLLTIYYRRSTQDDLFPISQYRRIEETWQIRSGLSLRGFTLLANADIGKQRDLLSGNENPYRRYTLYANLEPLAGQAIGLSAEYGKEHDLVTLAPQERLAGSVSLNVSISERTLFSCSLYGSRTRGEFDQTYTLFDLGFDHEFPWGHSLVLRGRQSIFSPSFESKEIAYLAEYTIPIGVPIARSKLSGQLVGQVLDSEKGTPVPNVLLYAGGATAVTDRNGEYSFPSLKPDKYVLQVDMSTVGLNRVTLQRMPQELSIVGGKESRFDVSITRSITVRGTVLLYMAEEQTAADTSAPVLKEPVGHPGAVLELSSGDEVHRRLSDSRGRFTFSDIRPGRWTLKIIEGSLPENFYFEKDVQEVAAAPGTSAEFVFKALPRRRRVRILTQGQVVAAPVQQQRAPQVTPKEKEAPPVKPEVVAQAPKKSEVPLPVQPQPRTKPEPRRPLASEISSRVIFVPRWLRFSIELSSWPTRRMADSAAAVLSKKVGQPSWVGYAGTTNGQARYNVFLGMLTTRRDAEIVRTRVTSFLNPRSE